MLLAVFTALALVFLFLNIFDWVPPWTWGIWLVLIALFMHLRGAMYLF